MACFISNALKVVLLLSVVCNATQIYADDDNSPIKITLYPSAEPKPALKYKLLPSRMDQIPGNAAVYYGKVKSEENVFFSNKELRDNIDRWQETPLEELVAEEAHVPSGGGIDFHLDRGARCRFCDWQMPIGDVQFYSTLLAEVQESRRFSRILAASARIDIAHKRYSSALRRFQTNYALGRHIAESEFIVSGLVGVATCGTMNAQVMEFVQQPETPNLYWALTALPSPLIDMREAVELESHGLELSYPELGNYEGVGLRSFSSVEQTHPELWKIPPSRRSPEEWKQLYYAILSNVHELIAGDDSELLRPADELESNCRKAFPLMKKQLVSRGMDAGKIKSMSMHQAALLYMLQLHHDQVDDMAKYYSLPYAEAVKGFDAVANHYHDVTADVPQELNVANHLVFAIKTAKRAQTRIEREIAVLRVFEALRIYGASHEGKLPEQLSDITEVPNPIDPVTGEPFVYRLEGSKAHLRGPALRRAPLNYEITMVAL